MKSFHKLMTQRVIVNKMVTKSKLLSVLFTRTNPSILLLNNKENLNNNKKMLSAGLFAVSLASTYLLSSNDVSMNESKEDVPKGIIKKNDNSVMTEEFTYFTGQGLKNKKNCVVFSGSGNTKLGGQIANYLGVELGKTKLGRFNDGEINFQVQENVRGKHCIIIQSCTPPKVDDYFMELLLMVSALRRSSAKTITVLMPYMPYMRSSEKTKGRTTIASKDTMMMLETMGVDRIVAVDMHAGQAQGFLSPNTPSDNISTIKIGAIFLSEYLRRTKSKQKNIVVVAPNAQAVPRAKEFWNVMTKKGYPDARFAMVLRKPIFDDAGRNSHSETKNISSLKKEYELVGDENLEGSYAVIVNDILDTANTTSAASFELKEKGVEKVFAFATHPVFSPGSVELIQNAPIDKVLVTNTLPEQSSDIDVNDKILRICVAPLLAETIRRIVDKDTFNPLYQLPPDKKNK